jgi:hypothetical protein
MPPKTTNSRLVPLLTRTALVAAVLTLLPGRVLLAAAEPPSRLLHSYTFTLGSYFTSVETDVRADEDLQQRATEVNFESDLDFSKSEELFRAEAQFLVKPRHQINFGYYELNRSASNVIQREIVWEDRVFPVNVDVTGIFNTEVLELSYTWWFKAEQEFVLGLNAGVQQIGMDIGLDLSAQATGGSIGGEVGFEEFVPLVGLELRRSLTENLMFRGLVRYITFSDLGDLKRAELIDAALGFEYRLFANASLGVAYKILNFDLDIERRLISGSVDYRLDGVEAFLRFGF